MRWIAFALLLLGMAGCRARAEARPPTADVSAILAASDLPALLPEPLPGDPLGVTIHRLSNGMTVYISTLRDEPRLEAWVVVRAGGRHDPPHATGLAHYLEHMLLFKGSDEIGTVDHAAEGPHLQRTRELYRELAKSPGDRERILAKIDAETSAVARTSVHNEVFALYQVLGFTGADGHTYADKTYYHAQIPANRIDAWAALTAEQFADPVFRLFYPELEAVYEEKNRGLDSPERRVYEESMRALFPAHPYGTQTVLGEVEHLKTPAFDEMEEFFARWYVPNNMAIVLAGDVDASVLPLLEQAFGRLQPRQLEAPATGELRSPDGRVVRTVTAPGEASITIAWAIPSVEHDDVVALELASALLADERVGLVSVGLPRSGVAPWGEAWVDVRPEAGVFAVEAGVREDTTHAAVEAALRSAVAQLRNTTPARLDAIKLQVAKGRAFQAERTWPRAQRMMDAFIHRLDWAEVIARDQKLDALTVADVTRVVDRYLGEASVVVERVRGQADVPKLAKPKITPLQFADAPRSPFGERIVAMPATPIEPVFLRAGKDFERIERPWGELVAARNTANDLFALQVSIDRGWRAAPLLCHALDAWMRSGTEGLDATALQERLFELGAGVRVQCDDTRVLVFVDGIDRHFDDTLALVRQWWSAPVFPPDTVRDVARDALAGRKASLDDDDEITRALRNKAYFGRESPQLLLPSNRAIEKATPAELRALVVGLTELRHRVVYSGPRSPAQVADAIAFGAGEREPEARWRRSYRRPDRMEIHVVQRASAKATVHVVFPGPAIESAAEAVPNVVGWELAHRAWDDVRGARALAYSVSAGIDLGRIGDQAALWGFLQAQPDKVAQAVPAMLAVLGVSELDKPTLARARDAIAETLRSSRTPVRARPFVVDTWRDRGLDRDPRQEVWKALPTIDVEATATLLGQLHASPAIVTIVGDTSRIDMDALGEQATIHLHEPAELFSY